MSEFSSSQYDALGDLFNRVSAKRPAEPKVAPLPQIRGKRIEGDLYLKATDVADCLAQLAPNANKRLIDKLRLAAQ